MIGNNLGYDEPIDYLKNIYWKRWTIEINFRYSKYNLSLKNLQSKNENTIRQDILIHNFIFIINAFFQYSLQNMLDTDHKISTTNNLNIIINELLYKLLYKSTTKKLLNEINDILNISKQTVIINKPNRNYDRIRKNQLASGVSMEIDFNLYINRI
jgi:hypothetical protein